MKKDIRLITTNNDISTLSFPIENFDEVDYFIYVILSGDEVLAGYNKHADLIFLRDADVKSNRTLDLFDAMMMFTKEDYDFFDQLYDECSSAEDRFNRMQEYMCPPTA